MALLLFPLELPPYLPVPIAPLPPQMGVFSVTREGNQGRFLVSVESGERDVSESV